jgi:uncharacterized protein DUF4242
VSHGPTVSRYLVELEAPANGWGDLQQLTARARAAVEELREEGKRVRFLRSIYVPEDESCFFLYEGDSVASVGAAGRRAQLQILRIAETLQAELK